MNLQPTLEDELVLLRPLTEADFDDLFSAANDPKIWEQHWDKHRFRKKNFSTYFREMESSRSALVIIDKDASTIIGSSRFALLPKSPASVEIGWTFIAKPFWGGFHNRLIKSLMIKHVFQTHEEVVFKIHKQNLRSQKATMKLGAFKADIDEYPDFHTFADSHVVFRIAKSCWFQ